MAGMPRTHPGRRRPIAASTRLAHDALVRVADNPAFHFDLARPPTSTPSCPPRPPPCRPCFGPASACPSATRVAQAVGQAGGRATCGPGRDRTSPRLAAARGRA